MAKTAKRPKAKPTRVWLAFFLTKWDNRIKPGIKYEELMRLKPEDIITIRQYPGKLTMDEAHVQASKDGKDIEGFKALRLQGLDFDQYHPLKPAAPIGEEDSTTCTVGSMARDAANMEFRKPDGTLVRLTDLTEDYELTDIITSMLHFAESKGWDAGDVMDSAANHWSDER